MEVSRGYIAKGSPVNIAYISFANRHPYKGGNYGKRRIQKNDIDI